MTLRPGLVLAAVFLAIYGTLALAVDLRRAAYGFHSDEATYYMMGYSLVEDHDLAYRREDLVRVWKEFPAGPVGVFLKKGRTIAGNPDPDSTRYFYGKSFIYPLAAAPFIVVFGTNGFLVLHALLIALVLLCSYLFLHARSGPWPSAILAAAFVMASVIPVYFVWIMPELFNFSLACLAYFCWLYKEVASPERSPRGTAWLLTARGDLAAAILLGIATFSKPTNALLFVPLVIWQVWPRNTRNALEDRPRSTRTTLEDRPRNTRTTLEDRPRNTRNALEDRPRSTRTTLEDQPRNTRNALEDRPRNTRTTLEDPPRNTRNSRIWIVLRTALVFSVVAGGLFAVNMAISGEWNYQGGERKSYYYEFPFQNEVPKHELGVEKSREAVLSNIIFNKRTFASNLGHNLEYFFVGRYAGMLGYFFPGFFAMLALLAAPRRRPGWQWLVLAAGLAQGLIFVIATPYTWSGGGVGNRYFASGYGVMLFALPPMESIALALVPWAIGGLFVAPIVLNPFVASFKPGDNAKSGPLRILPVELTLINDIPINNEPDRARIWFGDTQGDPGFLVYFLDDNAYGREADRSVWTRGDSRTELLFKADKPIRRALFTLTAGPVPVDVALHLSGRRQTVHLDAGTTQQITMAMPPGVAFEKEVEGVRVWDVSVTTRGGFTPIFYDPSSSDVRYLGVRVKPMLEARP